MDSKATVKTETGSAHKNYGNDTNRNLYDLNMRIIKIEKQLQRIENIVTSMNAALTTNNKQALTTALVKKKTMILASGIRTSFNKIIIIPIIFILCTLRH